jgi:hypothetical protein
VRNQSTVKATQLTTTKSNYFVNDVFELLDLDFDEYIRQVIFVFKKKIFIIIND